MIALTRVRAALTRRAARRRNDRALLRLARLAATEEEQRSPEWCWTHGCHRSQCPQPDNR
ncbi:hypothetical protein ACFZB5_33525 [Streptomyces nodosus]|uniref:hypothetical protein n=1 Tax=Streptomyces nodosus TaxID=40318 RepID=UPI0036F08C99